VNVPSIPGVLSTADLPLYCIMTGLVVVNPSQYPQTIERDPLEE
jgi:hypothetical protein